MEQTSTLDALVILVFFRIYLDNRLIGTRAERETVSLWVVRHRTRLLDLAVFISGIHFGKEYPFFTTTFSPTSSFYQLTLFSLLFLFLHLLLLQETILFLSSCFVLRTMPEYCTPFLFFSFLFNFWFENKDTFKLILLIKSLTCYLVLCPSSQFINTLALPNFLLGPSIFFFIYKLRFFF